MSLLKNLTVVEMAGVISGPSAGLILADLGATVIKVEPPGGDSFRFWEANGDSIRSSFAAFNRGKRSIVVDIKQREGRDTYLRLASTADVVLENYRPGRMDQLGIGWDRLHELNPRLVYCQISGRGNAGPDIDKPTYDAVAQAVSGLWSQFTELQDPEAVGPTLSDQLTGMYAAIAVLAAIQGRTETGEGRRVEVDMLSASLALSATAIAASTWSGAVATKSSRARNSQSYAFVAADGLPFAVHMSTPQKFWVGMCTAIGRTDLIEDERFVTKAERIRNYDELRSTLGETLRTGTRDTWLEKLAAADVPAAPILTIAEAVDTDQVRAKGIIDQSADPTLRGLVRSPVVVDGIHSGSDVPPPRLGGHTDEILRDAGFDDEHIARLRESGAVA